MIFSRALMLVLVLTITADAGVRYSYTGDTSKLVSGAHSTVRPVEGYFTMANLPTGNAVGIGQTTDRTALVTSYQFSDRVPTLTAANSTARIGLHVGHASLDSSGSVPRQWSSILGRSASEIATHGSYSDAGAGSAHVGTGSSGSPTSVNGAGSPRAETSGLPGTRIVQRVPTVSVPELAILPKLPRAIKLGLGIDAAITRYLQRATTWLAATLLRTPHGVTEIYLPSVTVKVIESCAGRQTLTLMLLVVGLIIAVKPMDLRFRVGLALGVIVIGLEANALRVAGISLGLERFEGLSLATKDWIGVGTTGLALVQIAVLGRLVGTRAAPGAMIHAHR